MNDWLVKTGLIKFNYKDQLVFTGAGIILVFFIVFSWLMFIIADFGKTIITGKLIFLVTITGSVGFIDDLVGRKDYQGFKGHFTQLLSGRLTTGVFKAIVSFVAVLLVINWEQSLFKLMVDTGLILLMTNFFNLLDVRPGRTLKLFFLISLILIIGMSVYRIYLLVIYFFLMLYLPFELQEKVMLGDCGANMLGVVIGFILSKWQFVIGKTLVLFLLLILTFFSERYSFSKYIGRNRILNWIDHLGRRN